MRYFEVDSDTSKIGEGIGIAYILDPDGEQPSFLPDGPVEQWDPPVFLVLEGIEGGRADYQPNDMGFRMCSTRLRDTLEQHSSKEDVLQWLDASVMTTQHWERIPYYVLHFPSAPDILDRGQTRYGPGGDNVVVPVLESEASENHDVFCYRGAGHFRLFVSEKVKSAIEAQGLTGLTFGGLRVTTA